MSVRQLVEGLAALVEHVDEKWDDEHGGEALLYQAKAQVAGEAPVSFPDGMPHEAIVALQQHLLAMPILEPRHFKDLALAGQLAEHLSNSLRVSALGAARQLQGALQPQQPDMDASDPPHQPSPSPEAAAALITSMCTQGGPMAGPGTESTSAQAQPYYATLQECMLQQLGEECMAGLTDWVIQLPPPEEAGPGLSTAAAHSGQGGFEVMHLDAGSDSSPRVQDLLLQDSQGSGASWGGSHDETGGAGLASGHAGASRPSARHTGLISGASGGADSAGTVEDLLASSGDLLGHDPGGLGPSGHEEWGQGWGGPSGSGSDHTDEHWMVFGDAGAGGGTSFNAAAVKRLVSQLIQGSPEQQTAALRTLSCQPQPTPAPAEASRHAGVAGAVHMSSKKQSAHSTAAQLHAEDVLFAPIWPELCAALPSLLMRADSSEAVFDAASYLFDALSTEAVAMSPPHAAELLIAMRTYLESSGAVVTLPLNARLTPRAVLHMLRAQVLQCAHLRLVYAALRLLRSLAFDWHFLPSHNQQGAADVLCGMIQCATEAHRKEPSMTQQDECAMLRPIHLLFLLDTELRWLQRLCSARASGKSLSDHLTHLQTRQPDAFHVLQRVHDALAAVGPSQHQRGHHEGLAMLPHTLAKQLLPAMVCAFLQLPPIAWQGTACFGLTCAQEVVVLVMQEACHGIMSADPSAIAASAWAMHSLTGLMDGQPELLSDKAMSQLLEQYVPKALMQLRWSGQPQPVRPADQPRRPHCLGAALLLLDFAAGVCTALARNATGARILLGGTTQCTGVSDATLVLPSTTSQTGAPPPLVVSANSVIQLQCWSLAGRPHGDASALVPPSPQVSPAQPAAAQSGGWADMLVPGSAWALVHAAIAVLGSGSASRSGAGAACGDRERSSAHPACTSQLLWQQRLLSKLVQQLVELTARTGLTASSRRSHHGMKSGNARERTSVRWAACDALISACAAAPLMVAILAQQPLAAHACAARLTARLQATAASGASASQLLTAAGNMALSGSLATVLVSSGVLHEVVLKGVAHGMAGSRTTHLHPTGLMRSSYTKVMEEVAGRCSGKVADELALGLHTSAVDCPRTLPLVAAQAVLMWQRLVVGCLVEPACSSPMGLHVLKSLVLWLDMHPSINADDGGRGGAATAMGPAAHTADSVHAALRCLSTWLHDPTALAALDASTHVRWYLQQLVQSAHLAVEDDTPQAQGVSTGRHPHKAIDAPHPTLVDMNGALALQLLAAISEGTTAMSARDAAVVQLMGQAADTPVWNRPVDLLTAVESTAGSCRKDGAIMAHVLSEPGMQNPTAWWQGAAAAVLADAAHLPSLPTQELALLLQRLVQVAWPASKLGTWESMWAGGGVVGSGMVADDGGVCAGQLSTSRLAWRHVGRVESAASQPTQPSQAALELAWDVLRAVKQLNKEPPSHTTPTRCCTITVSDNSSWAPTDDSTTPGPHPDATHVVSIATLVDAVWQLLQPASRSAQGGVTAWGGGVGGDAFLVLIIMLVAHAPTVQPVMSSPCCAADMASTLDLVTSLTSSPATPYVWPAFADAFMPGGADVIRTSLCTSVAWVLQQEDPELYQAFSGSTGGGVAVCSHLMVQLLGFSGSPEPGLCGGLALFGRAPLATVVKLLAIVLTSGPDFLVYAGATVLMHAREEVLEAGLKGSALNASTMHSIWHRFHIEQRAVTTMVKLCEQYRSTVLPYMSRVAAMDVC